MTNTTSTTLLPADSSSSPEFPKTQGATPKKRRLLTPILALVAAVGIGLFGGVLIGHATASTTQAGSAQQGGFPGGGTAGGTAPGGGGGFTSGTVASIDGDVITLTLTDGSTVTVTATDDTAVTTTQDSTVDALAAGDTITVMGTADDNGNVSSATSISEGATVGGFGGGGTPPTGGNN